ncbi:MAG: hypothetical protein ACI9IP_003146 [Arcticibacterium sp.]
MRIVGKIAVFLGILVVMSSCFKEPDFSFTPEISFDSINSVVRLDPFIGATKDSVIITIKFKDGDGDLGVNLGEDQIDTVGGKTDFNYLLTNFRKVNGSFLKFESSEVSSGYFPKLLYEEKPGAIEGKLNYSYDFIHAFTPKLDTLKFEVQIKDRAGNFSNVIETDEIVLNRL